MMPRRRRQPHWWPEGEPWPPRDAEYWWRRRRGRFLARLAIAMSLFWVFSAMGWAALGLPFVQGGGFLVLLIIPVLLMLALRGTATSIGDVVAAAHRVAHGDFSARIRPKGPPSVRAVAGAFNDMATRLAQQEKQRRELMADIAHELRTPLSVVQGRLEGLLDGVYPLERAQIEPLLEETRVLARLVEDLRTLANAESGVLVLQREPTDIGMLTRDAAAALRDEADHRQTTIAVEDNGGLPPAQVDPLRLRQVLVNLIGNAVRHTASGARVDVKASVANGVLDIRISDNGPGIPAEQLAKIFDRFVRGKASPGSGLGLTIARTLVEAHGGTIRAESAPGSGTTMTVSLPA